MAKRINMDFDLIIKNARCVEPHLGEWEGHIGVAKGKIAANFCSDSSLPRAHRIIDVEGRYVLPGLVDPHVHIGYWRSFSDECRSESHAAAIGGYTSIVVMLKMKNLPPEYRDRKSYLDIYHDLKGIIESSSAIDIAIRPYPNTPGQIAEIPRYVSEMGMTSFKFVTHFPFGGPEAEISGCWALNDGELVGAFEKIREARGVAVVHAENQEIIDHFTAPLIAAGRNDLMAWTESRPDLSELEPIQRISLLANRIGVPVYFVHVTTAASIDYLSQIRKQGWKVFAETCPQYLTFTANSSLGLLGKQKPPLRDEKSQARLWEALVDGTVSCLGSDHMPIKKETSLKGDIWNSPWGFPVIETMLPVLLSEGVRKGRITLQRLVELCSYNPACLFGMYPHKGTLRPGADADIVVIDLDLKQKVDPSRFPAYSDYSLWEGQELTGWPIMTMRRGEVLAEKGEITIPGGGKLLHQTHPIINFA